MTASRAATERSPSALSPSVQMSATPALMTSDRESMTGNIPTYLPTHNNLSVTRPGWPAGEYFFRPRVNIGCRSDSAVGGSGLVRTTRATHVDGAPEKSARPGGVRVVVSDPVDPSRRNELGVRFVWA